MSTCANVRSFIESKTSEVQTWNVDFTSEVSDYLVVHTGPGGDCAGKQTEEYRTTVELLTKMSGLSSRAAKLAAARGDKEKEKQLQHNAKVCVCVVVCVCRVCVCVWCVVVCMCVCRVCVCVCMCRVCVCVCVVMCVCVSTCRSVCMCC